MCDVSPEGFCWPENASSGDVPSPLDWREPAQCWPLPDGSVCCHAAEDGDELPVRSSGAPDAAARVAHELLGNAVKHGMRARLVGRIAARVVSDEGRVLLTVTDDGWGFGCEPRWARVSRSRSCSPASTAAPCGCGAGAT